MSKFWIVAMHTYIQKVKSKSFIISTAVILLFMAAFANLDRIIGLFGDEEEKIGVVALSGDYFAALQEQLKASGSELALEEFDSESNAKKAEEEGDISGYVLLEDQAGLPAGNYKAASIADSTESTELQNALQQVQTVIMTEKANITDEQLAAIYTPVSFEVEALNEDAKSEAELSQARGLVYIMIFAIYFSVLVYAGMIANEVAIEKSSRVMEILISSVSPIKQMFAKITGIALLTLTQLIIFVVVGYLALMNNSGVGDVFELFNFNNIETKTVIYAVVFTLLGYLLYATMAACLGSLVSKLEDLQQMLLPMTMLVIFGFLIAMNGLSNPEANFITITSYIPFFTPMIMFLRIGMLDIAPLEIAIGIILMLVTIGLLAYVGAKVYKGGVLMYSNSTSLKDIRKAINLTKNQ
ncbi:ABC transporter permease [Gracilibacillus sp. Marseille-QA3620]